MKQIIKSFFEFSKTERNGILVLIGLIVSIYTCGLILPYLPLAEEHIQNDEAFKKEIAEFESSFTKKDVSTIATIKLHTFDPNAAGESELIGLGFSPKLAKTVMNYRNHGGKFYKVQDLKKLYGMNENLFNSLETYVIIQNEKVLKQNQQVTIVPKKIKLEVELNSADSTELNLLKGIGPVLAGRIIKYRNKLGGFGSVDQLKEVFGLKPETLEAVKENIHVNASSIKRININTADFKSLFSHPYLHDYNVVKALLNYRHQHGEFKELSDLKNCKAIPEEIVAKVYPYLKTND